MRRGSLAGDPGTGPGTALRSPPGQRSLGAGQRHWAGGARARAQDSASRAGQKHGPRPERRSGEKAAVGGALGRGSERAGPAQRGRGPRRPAEDGAMTAEPQKRCEGTESRKAGGWRGGARPPAAHTAPRTATRLVLPTAHTRTGSSCPCAWPFSAQSGDTPYAIATATGPGPRTVLWSPRIRPFLPEFYSTHMKV